MGFFLPIFASRPSGYETFCPLFTPESLLYGAFWFSRVCVRINVQQFSKAGSPAQQSAVKVSPLFDAEVTHDLKGEEENEPSVRSEDR